MVNCVILFACAFKSEDVAYIFRIKLTRSVRDTDATWRVQIDF